MKAAICQTDIIWEDKERNYIIAEKYIEKAAKNNADLIIFPEMSFTGFTQSTKTCGEAAESSQTIQKMQSLSLKYNASIVFGVIVNKNSKSLNRTVITDNKGNIITHYDKIHPFSYSGEDNYFAGGTSITSAKIKDVIISPFICYDLRFPEPFLTASEKADLLIITANWPKSRITQWNALLCARAVENQAYVIGVNRTGIGNGIEYNGHSAAYDCFGTLIAKADCRPSIIYCEVSPKTVSDYRKSFPVRADRRPTLYSTLKL